MSDTSSLRAVPAEVTLGCPAKAMRTALMAFVISAAAEQDDGNYELEDFPVVVDGIRLTFSPVYVVATHAEFSLFVAASTLDPDPEEVMYVVARRSGSGTWHFDQTKYDKPGAEPRLDEFL